MNIHRFLIIKRNSKVSKSAKIYAFSRINHSKIDDFSYVSYNCTIHGGQIGKYCSIASGVKIGLGNHPINFISTSPIFYSPTNPLKYSLVQHQTFIEHEKVIIGNDVWIGTNAVILDGIKIGDGAIIGANSIVTKDVEAYSIVGGVPAREIRKRFPISVIDKLITLQWWNLPLEFLNREEIKSIFSKQIDEQSIRVLSENIENFLATSSRTK